MWAARVTLALSFATLTAAAEPIQTTTQSPFYSTVGLPAPLAAELGRGTSIGMTTNWSSSAIIEAHSEEELIVDSETKEFRLTFAHAFHERFAIQLELPYYEVQAGSLDSFIDEFHDVLGLPEGDRPLLEPDQLLLIYRRDGHQYLFQRRSASGIGDAVLSAGWQWIRNDDRAVSLWLGLNLPSAADDLYAFEDGAVDASLTVSARQRVGSRATLYGQASVTANTGDEFIYNQADVLWSGHIAADVNLTANVGVVLQLQAHSALVPDSAIELLDESAILTLGGYLNTASGWHVQLGISEDIVIEASPDVVFVFGIAKRWQ